MSHTVEIPFTNTRVFTQSVKGMQNVMHVLNSDVEAWLDASGSDWQFVGASRAWDHIKGLQIWYPYWDVIDFKLIELPPGQIWIDSEDVALLFKLTYGGV